MVCFEEEEEEIRGEGRVVSVFEGSCLCLWVVSVSQGWN